jgi:hypothetical protein
VSGSLTLQSSVFVTETEEFKSLRRLALASLGRNVLHFQRVEAQLKRLVLVCDFMATRDDLAARHNERVAELRMTTMGNLVNELHKRLYGKPVEPDIQESITQIFVRVQFRVEADPDYVARQRKKLSDLVLERNNLVHQDLAEFDPSSEESCRRWIARLNEQDEQIVAQHRELQDLLDVHNEAAKKIFALIQSDEFHH